MSSISTVNSLVRRFANERAVKNCPYTANFEVSAVYRNAIDKLVALNCQPRTQVTVMQMLRLSSIMIRLAAFSSHQDSHSKTVPESLPSILEPAKISALIDRLSNLDVLESYNDVLIYLNRLELYLRKTQEWKDYKSVSGVAAAFEMNLNDDGSIDFDGAQAFHPQATKEAADWHHARSWHIAELLSKES